MKGRNLRGYRFALATILAIVGLVGFLPWSHAQGATLDSAELDLVSRVNDFRAAKGLPTLAVSDTLTSAAKWMSTDMSVNNYFAHTSLDGRTPVQRMNDAGYPAFSTWTGEDLAAGYTASADVLSGWIASPAHYAVLTNPQYHAIGVGRSYGGGTAYGWYRSAGSRSRCARHQCLATTPSRCAASSTASPGSRIRASSSRSTCADARQFAD